MSKFIEKKKGICNYHIRWLTYNNQIALIPIEKNGYESNRGHNVKRMMSQTIYPRRGLFES